MLEANLKCANSIEFEEQDDRRADLALAINRLSNYCHGLNLKWWKNPKTGEYVKREFGTMVALMHSELSEALEADRKNLNDDKLPHRSGVEVELADLFIRVFDVAGAMGLDLGGAILEKIDYNKIRKDHTLEARALVDGKKY